MGQRTDRRQKMIEILHKLDSVSQILLEMRQFLTEEIGHAGLQQGVKVPRPAKTLPSDNELQIEYEKLLSHYVAEGPHVVREFVDKHSSVYIEHFAKANNLGIYAKKMNKEERARLLTRALAESCTIRGILRSSPASGNAGESESETQA